jgi:GNAT superfamily N-acetyltransferase
MNAAAAPTDSVRLATPVDLPRINSLIQKSVSALASCAYDAAQLDAALTHVLGADPQLVADGTHYVVERRDRLVASGAWSFRPRLCGAGAGSLATDERLNPAFAPAVLRHFYVHPEHARKGFGRCLLQACEAAAARAGFGSIELVSLIAGLGFFRACGYVVLHHWELSLPNSVGLPVVWMHKPAIE